MTQKLIIRLGITLFSAIMVLLNPLWSREPKRQLYVLSELVGDTIDLEERTTYEMFPSIEGFQSAVLYQLSDSQFVFNIVYLDSVSKEVQNKSIHLSIDDLQKIRAGLGDYLGYIEPADASVAKIGDISETMVKAKRFDELTLKTKLDITYKGKIIGLDGDSLFFLPHPYWGVNLLAIQLDDIRSIKLPDSKEYIVPLVMLSGPILGYACGYLMSTTGSLRYREDYASAIAQANQDAESGLCLGACISTSCGLLVVVTGPRKFFRLYNAPKEKKTTRILKIMGIYD